MHAKKRLNVVSLMRIAPYLNFFLTMIEEGIDIEKVFKISNF